jgi:SOS-response transcriptional repressor LexA
MSDRDLTPTQAKALAVIRRFVSRYGRPPSCRDLATALGHASVTGAHETIHRLARAECLELDDRGQIKIGSLNAVG